MRDDMPSAPGLGGSDMQTRKVFLDHVSSTPTLPEVVEAMLPYFAERYGNPSSHLIEPGIVVKSAMEEAREKVARLIGAGPGEIVFTAGGTEGNNLAVKGLALAQREKGDHIVISNIEHFSVLYAAQALEQQGFEVTLVPVAPDGLVDPPAVERAITERTVLVSIVYANTEIGTIQPIAEIGRLAREREVLFHADGVGAVGAIPVNVAELGVDALSFAAQTFYGPKGVGGLYLRKGVRLVPLMQGGFQEVGRRPGTENVPGIVGMGVAAERAREEMGARAEHLTGLQRRLWAGLEERIQFLHFTGHPRRRLPGHVSFWIEFAEGESLVLFLNMHGIFAASGSACSSPDLQPSHVLTAVGVPPEFCHGSLTMSMGIGNTQGDVDYVLDVMPQVVQRLWDMSPLYADRMKQGGK